jgi:predicted metal-dependent phosphoesterase TrpH
MSPLEVIEWACEHTRLSAIAICDHNTNEGALEAHALASDNRFPLDVIVGQEVESQSGHILGLWTPHLVKPGRTAQETVDDIHAQGGLAIVAHPYAPKWWHRHGLCRGDTTVYDAVDFDGVEIANSTPLLFLANFRARSYWRRNRSRLAATGGSDAHMLSVIGSSRTIFRGSTAEDLRRALEARETRGWGPSFNPLRGLFYARKVPQIKQLNREREEREAAQSRADGSQSQGGSDAPGTD